MTVTSSQPSSPHWSRICLVACVSSGTVAYSHFVMVRSLTTRFGSATGVAARRTLARAEGAGRAGVAAPELPLRCEGTGWAGHGEPGSGPRRDARHPPRNGPARAVLLRWSRGHAHRWLDGRTRPGAAARGHRKGWHREDDRRGRARLGPRHGWT